MIVWQGAGILAIVIPAVLGGIAQEAVDAHFGSGYAKLHMWQNAVAWTVGAAIVWMLGTSLERRPGKKLVDPSTNEQIELKEKHTMFWVPMQYWSIAWIVASVVSMVK